MRACSSFAESIATASRRGNQEEALAEDPVVGTCRGRGGRLVWVNVFDFLTSFLAVISGSDFWDYADGFCFLVDGGFCDYVALSPKCTVSFTVPTFAQSSSSPSPPPSPASSHAWSLQRLSAASLFQGPWRGLMPATMASRTGAASPGRSDEHCTSPPTYWRSVAAYIWGGVKLHVVGLLNTIYAVAEFLAWLTT